MESVRTVPLPVLPIIPSATTETRAWAVSGLHCAACAETLRQQLLALPGVRSARVGYAAGVAVVDGPVGLQPAVAGFRLAPLTPARSAELRRDEARALLWRLFVAAFCSMQIMMLAAPTYFAEGAEVPADLRQLLGLASWVLSWPVMLWSAQPFLTGAWRSLCTGRLGMDLPVALGALVTFGASSLVLFEPGGRFGRELYFDSLSMFIAFLLAGRYVELRARHAAAAELAALVAEHPAQAQRERPEGGVDSVPAEALRAGDLLRVGVGERLPVDAMLLSDEALLDEALLSGESRPVRHAAGQTLPAGALNLGAPLRVRALGGLQQGRAAQLAQQLQTALTERPQALALADRAAQRFLAGMLLLAAAAGAIWWWMAPARALEVVCAVLIVSCPCAFALAAPAARVASHRHLARAGLLLQRLEALEALAEVDTVMLDKTGTLSEPAAQPQGELARVPAAAALAAWSRHPMAQAVARLGADATVWVDVQELPGIGLHARDAQGAVWTLAADGAGGLGFGPEGASPALVFRLDERLRDDAPAMVATLRAAGLQLQLLSGDAPARVQALAAQLGIAAAQGGCSPEAKRAAVQIAQAEGRRVLMVGDGINDAPVLGQADASLAVAGATPLAARAADALLLHGDLSAVSLLVEQARRTRRITRQNLVWAAIYNLLAVPLAVTGWLPPWAAGLGMAASSALVVLNALRLAR